MTLRVTIVDSDGIPLIEGGALSVGLELVEVGVELTRPADTPGAYSVSDVIANSTSSPTVLKLENVVSDNGGHGYISKFRAFTNSATALLGCQIRVHIYNAVPTAINDHAQFPLLYANRSTRVGYVDLPAFATGGTGSDSCHALWIDLPLKFHCASNDTSLWIVPEVRAAGAAPASGQKIHFFAGIERH